MARRETVVLTNMCMVYDGEGNMLVQDRLNPEWPGVTFPGGHVEPGESFTLMQSFRYERRLQSIKSYSPPVTAALVRSSRFPHRPSAPPAYRLQTDRSFDRSSPPTDTAPTHCA